LKPQFNAFIRSCGRDVDGQKENMTLYQFKKKKKHLSCVSSCLKTTEVISEQKIHGYHDLPDPAASFPDLRKAVILQMSYMTDAP